MMFKLTHKLTNQPLECLTGKLVGDNLEVALDKETRLLPLADYHIKAKDLLLCKILARLDKLGLELDKDSYTLVGLESTSNTMALVLTVGKETILVREANATANGCFAIPLDTKFEKVWVKGKDKDFVGLRDALSKPSDYIDYMAQLNTGKQKQFSYILLDATKL